MTTRTSSAEKSKLVNVEHSLPREIATSSPIRVEEDYEDQEVSNKYVPKRRTLSTTVQTPRYYVNGQYTLLKDDPMHKRLLLTKQRHQSIF